MWRPESDERLECKMNMKAGSTGGMAGIRDNIMMMMRQGLKHIPGTAGMCG